MATAVLNGSPSAQAFGSSSVRGFSAQSAALRTEVSSSEFGKALADRYERSFDESTWVSLEDSRASRAKLRSSLFGDV
jgi:hypothetical protein